VSNPISTLLTVQFVSTTGRRDREREPTGSPKLLTLLTLNSELPGTASQRPLAIIIYGREC